MLTLVLGALVTFGGAVPAQAAQATGDDVATWYNGWSWTYDTTFTYNDPATANVNLTERVTYTVADSNATFDGEPAYRLTISGTVTGGGGSATVPDFGNVNLDIDGGNVTGTRYVRRSDLALLQEQQTQHVDATANILFGVDVTADVNLTLTPEPSWRNYDFPLNPGDSWNNSSAITYTGGFSYDAGIGGTGSSPFDGVFDFNGPANVAAETIGVPIGSVPTDRILSTSSDGSIDRHWWSPTYKNDARHYMQLPLDAATLTIDRQLRSASTPAPSSTITETITPSLTCAGGPVQVTGKVGNAAGTPVQVALDRSPVAPGQRITVNTTTGAGGNYSATLSAPSENDGMGKNGSRANWGVEVASGSARNVATLVVTHRNCTTLEYLGVTSAPQGSDAVVAAKLTDLTGASAAGRTVTFTLGGGGTVNGTTNAAGVATATLPVNSPPRDTTITASYAGTATTEAANASSPFTVGKIATTTSVVANPPIVTVGDPVTFTATVAPSHGGNPGGSVQFKVDGADFGGPVG
ncbi:MAG TPA: Ig-like domain-containing protein, partial [Nocardioides sp.]|nr:Ig-like domain-containing protein [Nocardioides sp.]